MSLFINQKQQRSELQSKIDNDLRERVKAANVHNDGDVGGGILEETEEASKSSLIWVGIGTLIVIGLVALVIVLFNGA